jgi:hypothetical protein
MFSYSIGTSSTTLTPNTNVFIDSSVILNYNVNNPTDLSTVISNTSMGAMTSQLSTSNASSYAQAVADIQYFINSANPLKVID